LVITNNETVLDPKDAKLDMHLVYELINKPTLQGTPSNSGLFSVSAYNPCIVNPASLVSPVVSQGLRLSGSSGE
jgi:hypothetical protein